ncbi:ABC transporter permease [Kineococcus sp. NUM-3379]
MNYVLRKLGFYAVAAWAAITLNFAIPRMLPGDPVDILLAKLAGRGGQITPATRAAVEAMLGGDSDASLLSQYWTYLRNLARGDLGTSVSYYPAPVSEVIGASMPWTIILIGLATTLAAVLGVALGAFVGWRPGSWLDSLVPATTLLAAVPYFWLSLVLVYFLSRKAGLFPSQGGYDVVLDPGWNADFISSALYYGFLPALTIVLASVGGWLLGMRNMMGSTLSEDYVLTARAKGLPGSWVMRNYAARNAVLPSIAGFAISLGFVVSGSVVTEQVFSYPGIGNRLLGAVTNNDYALMQGVFLYITLAVLGANLVVDLLYGLIDPRTRAKA